MMFFVGFFAFVAVVINWHFRLPNGLKENESTKAIAESRTVIEERRQKAIDEALAKGTTHYQFESTSLPIPLN